MVLLPTSSSSSPSSSKSPPSTSPPPPHRHHHHPHFTPIQECHRELEQEDICLEKKAAASPKYYPTPLHHQQHNKNGSKPASKKRLDSDSESSYDESVACNKCRPHAREKISVVPLDNNNNGHGGGQNKPSPNFSMASPNGIFKSIVSSLTRKSPKSTNDVSALNVKEEPWKIAVGELSSKLIQATRKRDEAVLEASKLKYSMTELEKKLNKLEVYCQNLKSGLEECSSGTNPNLPYRLGKNQKHVAINQLNHEQNGIGVAEKVIIENFLVSVSEARSSIRNLSRSLTMQLRHLGTKVYERISALLQPYDVKILLSKNPGNLIFYLEALLNQAFFEDFESIRFQKHSPNQILNPIEQCEANFASFNVLQGLTWDEVLSKGTRHFSEEFSRFCDRKMSEIVAMLGWNRAWSEPLLQAFFSASKSVWLVHLLATSVHPSLPIFRVEKGIDFDSDYMEDMGGDRSTAARNLIPAVVRIMVTPGFYVHGSVVKCKVLCRYRNGPIMV